MRNDQGCGFPNADEPAALNRFLLSTSDGRSEILFGLALACRVFFWYFSRNLSAS
jgi:hypothetical protein